MKFLRNIWYVALWAEQLPVGGLFPRTLLSEALVFFRDPEGNPVAMQDACPHRFAPLHQGKLTEAGHLKCAYHGLEFSSTGECVHNPHGKTPPAGVKTYPVMEKHSIIWVWMGDASKADPDLIPDFPMLDPDAEIQITQRDHLRMDANYELITDNLLDLSHVSFLHEGILGNEDTIPADITVEKEGNRITVGRFMPNVRAPGMFDLLYKRDGGRVDMWSVMRWDPPGCMRNDSGVTAPGDQREKGTGIFGTHFLTPETERTTHYHFAAVRQNPLPFPPEEEVAIREKLTELRRIAFAEQDAPLIEAQQRNVDQATRDGLKPMLLTVDAGAAAYQRIMRKLIAQET